MASKISTRTRHPALVMMAGVIVFVVVVTCLYWAQLIFIPLALAVFLAFLLSPIVGFLERRGLGRTPSVLASVVFMLLLIAGMVWLVTVQATAVATRLPQYSDNIQKKLKVVSGRLESLSHYASRFLEAQPPPAGTEQKPVVVVQQPPNQWSTYLLPVLTPAAQFAGGGTLALVLTAFILLQREDLRNRLIRLAGQGRVTMATRVLDEAGHRISRFLLMQALIGAICGGVIGLGLLILGVDYALLWGFLIFLLRYVPYLGVWAAAVPPVLLSFAMSPGWTQPILVVALVVCVELFCAYVLEPWWYGHSMGVSQFALLVSAAIWAFLWGPVGMVLSSPLTVCLVVLGKYHPGLTFLDVLLGDEPALGPDLSFYQRLLARDQDEASEIVQNRLSEMPPDQAFDQLLIPALVYARRDRDRGDLLEDDEEFILQAVAEIGEEAAERLEHESVNEHPPVEGRLLACPAHDVEDELALRLLVTALDPKRWKSTVVPTGRLSSDVLLRGDAEVPDVVCIASLPPGALAHTRYLCKRLRARFPEAKIVVGRWGLLSTANDNAGLLRKAGADLVTTSLTETREKMLALLHPGEKAPVSPQREHEPVAAGLRTI
jgi:predicted PurR-regulated permease PerM